MTNIFSIFLAKPDEASFEAIISPHINSLFKVAYQYTGSQHDAEDLLQDMLEHLFTKTKQHELNNVEKIKPWLMRCLYHRFIDSYRKKVRQPTVEDIDDKKVQPLFQHQDDHQKGDHQQAIFSAMKILPKEQRAIITLHDINGYTLPELSMIMDTPLGTLKSSLHRARAALKTRLTIRPSDLSIRHY